MYRTIDTATWFDPKVKSLPPDGKLLFVYLFTNSHTHVSGIYYCPSQFMVHETGISPERVDTLLDTLSEAGMVSWDRVSEVIWVRKMFDRQGLGRKNSLAAASHLATLHKCSLIKDFLQFYEHRNIPYRYPIDTVCAQEQEQEQETGTGTGLGASPLKTPAIEKKTRKKRSQNRAYCPEFNRFWDAYPRRESKAKAFEAWKAAGARIKESKGLTSQAAAAYILERSTAYARSERGSWPLDKIPFASTWLNQDRFDDDPEAWTVAYDAEPVHAAPPAPGPVVCRSCRQPITGVAFFGDTCEACYYENEGNGAVKSMELRKP